MGAGASVDAQAAAKMQTRSRIVTAFLNLSNKPHHAPLVAAKTQWRIAAPYAGTAAEPSTNGQELLNMLHGHGAWEHHVRAHRHLVGWLIIYLCGLCFWQKKINDMETNPSLTTPEFFDPLMANIVNDMCQNTFLRFKTTPEYDAYKKDVKDTYNKVTVEDFEYLELLGSGGFGRVVHARKRSMGKHYVKGWSAGRAPRSAEPDHVRERHSPSTPAHAIIVTELVRGGDLGEALKASREGYIIEDRVRLYAAEIGLALNHMHELGLIYRDLKPGNVLLGEDGHVILADMGLADMGLAAGFDPTLLKKDENNSKYIPVNPKLTRRKTTVGTRGYMAPEIISGKLVKRDQRPGYTFAVDYWSLGVTIFELMCGYQPFSVYSGGNFFQEVANEEIFRLSPRTQHKIELQKMAQGVTFPAHISKYGQDFLKRLLDVNVEQRLGCNSEKGFAEFMEHPFFESIDWEKLMMKHIDPKFKPALPLLTDKKSTTHDWYADPPPEQQKHFESWDYISQSTLWAELGIAKELDETNIPYKVLQLTGEDMKGKQLKPANQRT
ncbi:Agc protein kinase, partial [Globisporangium splendens]